MGISKHFSVFLLGKYSFRFKNSIFIVLNFKLINYFSMFHNKYPLLILLCHAKIKDVGELGAQRGRVAATM